MTRCLALILLAHLCHSAVAAGTPPSPEWQTMPTEAYPKKRDDIVFVDRQTGFYGTGKGRLFRTDDGGQTWRLAWEHAGTFIRSLAFVDTLHGFLGNLGVGLGIEGVTDPVALYRTTDGGATWQPTNAPAIAGICSIDVVKARAIHEGDIRDRIVIHAAGRANGPAQLLRSEDAGSTWTSIDLSDRAGMILDVKFLDPDVGFVFAATSSDIAASHALILKTSNGGRTWREVYRSKRVQEIIWKGSFPSNQTGYATVQSADPKNAQQRIVKSIDGGAHWKEMPLVRSSKALELGIGFATEKHGWVGTAEGSVETVDGGRTWIDSRLAPKANKIRTQAADGTPMIYAIGSEVQIFSAR